jgi:hypothetical protein
MHTMILSKPLFTGAGQTPRQNGHFSSRPSKTHGVQRGRRTPHLLQRTVGRIGVVVIEG